MKKISHYLFGWIPYIRRAYARKMVLARREMLRETIRVVISFDETKGSSSAVIKAGQFTIIKLYDGKEEGALEATPEILHHLRTINRHVAL